MLLSRKRPVFLFVAVVFFIVLLSVNSDRGRIYVQWASSIELLAQEYPANRTLGFGAVVVVSKEGSKRRHALLQAANITDIDLTIPKQPAWTEGDIEIFRNNEDRNRYKGSILAWLGHHNALRWFLDSGLETALILEDDVDWDVRLRSIQVPLAASAARSLLPPATHASLSLKDNSKRTHYWGNPASWDLLYLGHCGDYFGAVTDNGLSPDNIAFNLSTSPHADYHDPTLPSKSELHPFTKDLFDALNLRDHYRSFHRSQFPLCSFGYAVTRPAAERLLSDLAPATYKSKSPRAFDVALLHSCRKGSGTPSPTPPQNPNPHPDPNLRHKFASPGLRCWTLNSELFHHMPGQSQIGEIEQASGNEHNIPPVDLAGQVQVINRNETTNIGCGFWNGAFAFDDNDTDRLHFLQEVVGRGGQCLKEGRDFN